MDGHGSLPRDRPVWSQRVEVPRRKMSNSNGEGVMARRLLARQLPQKSQSLPEGPGRGLEQPDSTKFDLWGQIDAWNTLSYVLVVTLDELRSV